MFFWATLDCRSVSAKVMIDGFFISLHKVLVGHLLLGLTWWFNNTSIEMGVYPGTRGTHALRRAFDARRTCSSERSSLPGSTRQSILQKALFKG